MEAASVKCSSCGAPLDAAADAVSAACRYCGTTTRIMRKPPKRAESPKSRAPMAWLVPVTLAALGLSAYGAIRGSHRAPPLPDAHERPSAANPISTAGAALSEMPAKAEAPEASAPPANLERGPVTLIWQGTIRSSVGAAPKVGSHCTLTARVTSDGARAQHDLLSLQCGGTVLYDSTLPLEGMSNSRFGLAEEPSAGAMLSFRYDMVADDLGTRSGPKAQITANSQSRVLEVFRDTAPSFHVKVSMEGESPRRKGPPLFAATLPPFDEVVHRTAKVVSKSGLPPFASASCDLRISPAYSKGLTCRATLVCGGKEVYGSGNTGYNECIIRERQPMSFVDPNPTAASSDPELQVDLNSGTATLGDTAKSGRAYSVAFALTP